MARRPPSPAAWHPAAARLHRLVLAALFGAMALLGPWLPPIVFHHLGLAPLEAGRTMGVIFHRTTPLLAGLAAAGLALEAVRLAAGERPVWWLAALRYGAQAVCLACLLAFLWHSIPAIEQLHALGPEALAGGRFAAIHEQSRHLFAAGLLAAAVAVASA